jgi:hypothetical protein
MWEPRRHVTEITSPPPSPWKVTVWLAEKHGDRIAIVRWWINEKFSLQLPYLYLILVRGSVYSMYLWPHDELESLETSVVQANNYFRGTLVVSGASQEMSPHFYMNWKFVIGFTKACLPLVPPPLNLDVRSLLWRSHRTHKYTLSAEILAGGTHSYHFCFK